MEKKKIIIGLVGKIAAGKGTTAAYLEKKYHASVYRFSDIMRDVLIRLHIPVKRHNLQLISTLIRQNFAENIFAKIIAENVVKDNNNIITVDGIRRMADIKYLRENKNFKLTRIKTDAEARYQRQLKRNEKQDDTQKSYKEFLADEQKEADAEIPLVAEKAVAEINNNGSFKELYEQVDRIIKSS